MGDDDDKRDAAWEWVRKGWKLDKASGTWTNPAGEGPYALDYGNGTMVPLAGIGPGQARLPDAPAPAAQANVVTSPPMPAALEHEHRGSSPYIVLRELAGEDVAEIFGPTGSGKSLIAASVALDAREDGKKVFYRDTERNLPKKVVEALGRDYSYDPRMSELLKWTDRVENLPKVDLIVLDSLGYPVLASYARMSMKERGEALLQAIAVTARLKEWAYVNHGLALVVNQPISEMGLQEGEEARPFAAKHAFAAKLIMRTVLLRGGKPDREGKTLGELRVWRGRDMARDHLLATYAIGERVEIWWKR